MDFNSREFRNAMGCFSTGVTVITVNGEDDVHAMTANAVSSVSLDPPIVLICLDHGSNCLKFIKETGYFGINILKESQIGISKFFANQQIDQDPFFSFNKSENGAPLLTDALVNLNCKVIKETEMGDHAVFFGRVLDLKIDEGSPLCFYKGQYRKLAQ